MLELIILGATALTLAFPLVAAALGMRRTIGMQLVLLPIAHVYAGGLALFGTVAINFLRQLLGNERLVLPGTPVAIWAAWAVIVAAGFARGIPGAGELSQIAQFAFYGALLIFATSAMLEDRRVWELVIRGLLWGSIVLGGVMVLGFGILNGALETVPLSTIGRNEHSVVLVFTAIVPAAWVMASGGPKRLAIAAVVAAVLAARAAEARGPLSIALAMLGGVAAYRFASRRVFGTIVLMIIGGAFASQWIDWAPIVAALFGQDNFSNLERLGLLQASLRLFLEQPLLGWGWGSLDNLMPRVPETIGSYPHAHNTFAHFAVELGILGLAILVALIAQPIVGAVRAYRQKRRADFIFLAALGVAFLATSLIEDLVYGATRAVPLMIVLAVAQPVIAGRWSLDVEPDQRGTA